MKKGNRKGQNFFALGAALLALLATSPAWGAEKYPNRPINMIVGYSPGGASDLGSRIVGEKVGEVLGQPMISVYKPGGNGTLAASLVAKAKPDGYNVLVMVSFMPLPPEISKLDYTMDDFILMNNFAITPNFVAVKADSKWKTLKDFLDDVKSNPGKYSYGSTPPYNSGHFTYSLLAKKAGIKLSHVPYKSCGEAVTALLGGHVDSYFCVGAGAITDSTLVRTLAVAEPKRLPGLGDIPTLTEQGYPIVYHTYMTYAFPKGTPKEIVEVFGDAQKKAYAKYAKEIAAGLRKVEMWPAFLDMPETLQEYKNQYEIHREIAKETGPVAPAK